jgi:predicted RND superfamily exporter protein
MTVKSDERRPSLGRRVRSSQALRAAVMLGCVFLASTSPSSASAATAAAAAANITRTGPAATAGEGGGSLEAAATKAGDMGRKIAMSLIGLALAVAGIVLAFRRDFKAVAGVLVVGLLAVLLATPTGLSVLQNTVNSLFGSS